MENKEIIIFDLDGTLAESKKDLDDDMSFLLSMLLDKKKVAVISGGAYKQFENQFVRHIHGKMRNLFLFPTCATQFYRYEGEGFVKVYEDRLKDEEKKLIFSGFEKAFKDVRYSHPEKTYGEVIEDRETQITFSALGQKAPLEQKVRFDPTNEIRMKIKRRLDEYLPNFDVKLGGTTSIDVTKKGIDKGYGIRKIQEYLGIDKKEMLFVGDALYEGGNDHSVLKEGVECVSVKDHDECKELIRRWLGACELSEK